MIGQGAGWRFDRDPGAAAATAPDRSQNLYLIAMYSMYCVYNVMTFMGQLPQPSLNVMDSAAVWHLCRSDGAL